jgi:PAS domain S-box-containing protein
LIVILRPYYKFLENYIVKIKQSIKKYQMKAAHLLHKDADGYDVYDFRVGTLLGTLILMFVPIVNILFMQVIPDHFFARNVLMIVQIAAIFASYKFVWVKKWANEIGNGFSLAYAALTTTVAYLHNFQIRETAFAMMIIFALFGMFKEKKMLLYFMLLTCSYLMSLIFASDISMQSKQFLIFLSLPFFGIGYYVFSIKLDAIQKIINREKELRQSEIWFRSIFDNAAVGIVLLDKNQKAFKFNQFFQEITGLSEANLIETGIENMIHPDDLFETKEFKQMIELNNPPIVEQRIKTKTRDYIWMRCSFSQMTVSEQQHTICMFIDITSQKLADEKLKENSKQLVSHNEALEEFSYVISHDLQEPLRMITSFSQIIKKRYLSKFEDEQAGNDFAYVIDGAKRMSNLIKDMLEYSRWSAKALPVEQVDTRAVLAETLQNLTITLSNGHAEVVSEDMPTIHANRLMVTQVFQNLIGNAVRYAHPDRDPVIEIKVEVRPYDVLFSVKDNGLGFEEQYADRIFGIFQRLHPEKSSGTGMGLAICKRIIEKQGGRIWAESVLHEGSTFHFSLPLLVTRANLPLPTLKNSDLVN